MDRLSLRQNKDVAMKKVFVVRLTETERSELDGLVRKGKASALTIARARILLKADQGKEAEAKLVATCCGPAPQGRARWTLRMLADKLVELQVVDSISPETVRSTLKKTRSSLG